MNTDEDAAWPFEALPAEPTLSVYGLGRDYEGSRVNWIDQLSSHLRESPWRLAEALVDGVVHAATQYERDPYWVAVLDLDEVAVGIFGKRISVSDCEFVSVNTSLQSYSVRNRSQGNRRTSQQRSR